MRGDALGQYLLSFVVGLEFSVDVGKSGEQVNVVTLTESNSCIGIPQSLDTDKKGYVTAERCCGFWNK